MTTSAPQQQTAAANQARRRQTEEKLQRVADALRRLQRDKAPVTYAAVAARAMVSRTFLYENPDARKLLAQAITRSTDQRERDQSEQDAQVEASWRERALNAEDAVKRAHREIQAQRRQIGQLLGQLRAMEQEMTEDTIQRITSENITLKQRVRQLIRDGQQLEERLQAARSNGRFLDRRIADLEAQLVEARTP